MDRSVAGATVTLHRRWPSLAVVRLAGHMRQRVAPASAAAVPAMQCLHWVAPHE
jgi:hypothetical protein